MENNAYNAEKDILQEQNPLSNNRFIISKKDMVFTVLFCISAVILSAFGIFGGFRGGFTVALLLLFAFTTAYFCEKGITLRIYPFICGILACLTSLCFLITSNIAVRFFSTILAFVLSLVWFVSLAKKESDKDDFTLAVDVVSPLIVGAIPNMPNTLVSLFTGEGERRKTVGRMLIGMVAAIPVLIIVIPLLMSSDEAFSSLMNKVFGNLVFSIFKTAFGLILAWLIVSYCFTVKKRGIEEVKRVEIKGIENAAVISFLSVISICYLMYLFSQLAYFFSAFKGILPENYTFTVSAYARRGFFEMSVIAVINLILVFAVLLFSRKKEGKICAANKAISTFICGFTLIIIATALSKMILYIKSFGMTELRITTSAFMLFLAVVFIGVILRIFIRGIRVLRVAFVTAGCILVILGTLNVNAVIAKYNYTAYKSGLLKDIDVNTIYEVGDEGIPYLVLLAKDNDSAVAESAKEKIVLAINGNSYYETEIEYKEIEDLVYWEEYTIVGKKHIGLGEYSISRNKAYESLDKYLEENPHILKSEIYSYDTTY